MEIVLIGYSSPQLGKHEFSRSSSSSFPIIYTDHLDYNRDGTRLYTGKERPVTLCPLARALIIHPRHHIRRARHLQAAVGSLT